MPIVTRQSIDLAIRNIAQHGDTDVFPLPLENHWFYDSHDSIVEILEAIDADFDSWMASYPIVYVKSLSGVGYYGFRTAAQLDSIWNAYLLALVIEIGGDIEGARVDLNKDIVFSYRFHINSEKSIIFNPAIGWSAFQRKALEKAASSEYVLSTDISDFYPRIYHHRLENALHQSTQNKEAVKRIMVMLFRLSAETSYGLPIGGNAARLLAELLLNRVDRLLLSHRVGFIRFVDDYYFFAESHEKIQRGLVLLSECLLLEGLALSRAKTRLMTRAEFLRSSPIADTVVADSEEELEARRFLKLRLTYDPYSPTASEDYDNLARELEKFDIVGMLAQELKKSRIDEVLVKQLIKSIKFLSSIAREQCVDSILRNLKVLYPIFPTVVILLKAILESIESKTRECIFLTMRDLVRSKSHIILVPTNLAYAIRLLAYDNDEETDSLLIEIYESSQVNMMIKRDIILAMTRRRSTYWLSPEIRKFSMLSPWEKRALIVASYTLGDEGKHWRKSICHQHNAIEKSFRKWVGSKNQGIIWDVPL